MKLAKVFKTAIFITLCFITVNLFSLPGVNDYLPTQSGQYVYYRDYTYIDETYIGFLQYDEKTFAARYFSPKTEKGVLNAEILFTIDDSKDFLNLTGEKIIDAPADGNVEPLNYLHELLYEFNSKRSKILGENISSGFHKVATDFSLFGGETIIIYDFAVPLFNIAKIQDNSGKILFEAVCVNTLTSSEDTSFSTFSGFSDLPKKLKDTKTKAKKLDKKWKSVGENMWLMGDDAFVFSSPMEIQGTINEVFDLFTRLNLHSSEKNYCYYPKTSIQRKQTDSTNILIQETMQYNVEKKTWTKDIKILQHNDGNIFNYSSVTVFYDFYCKNEKYFTNIVKKLSE